jgi:hypothetical protein
MTRSQVEVNRSFEGIYGLNLHVEARTKETGFLEFSWRFPNTHSLDHEYLDSMFLRNVRELSRYAASYPRG